MLRFYSSKFSVDFFLFYELEILINLTFFCIFLGDTTASNYLQFGVDKYIKGEILDPETDMCGLCNWWVIWKKCKKTFFYYKLIKNNELFKFFRVWIWSYLGPQYSPKYIHELRCDSQDDKCLSGILIKIFFWKYFINFKCEKIPGNGRCKPRCTKHTVLNTETNEKVDIFRSTGCECQVKLQFIVKFTFYNFFFQIWNISVVKKITIFVSSRGYMKA